VTRRDKMATNEGTNESWRKFLVPGAASVVGAGVGLALTRTNKLRDSLPSLGDAGIGNFADDLRTKLSSMTTNPTAGGGSSSSSRQTLDSGELEEHRRRRAQRRKQRAGR
jgi:hypothetical protein